MASDKSLNNKKITDKPESNNNVSGATSATMNSEKLSGNKRKLRRAVSSSDEECEVSPGLTEKQANDNIFAGQPETEIGSFINVLFPSHPNKKKLTASLKTLYNRIVGNVAHNQSPSNATTTHPNNIPILPNIYGQGLNSLIPHDIIAETISTESNAILTEKRLLLERRLLDARTRVIIANAELSVLGKNDGNCALTHNNNSNNNAVAKKNSPEPKELLSEKTKKNWITIMVPNDNNKKSRSKESRKKYHDERLFDEACDTTTTETDWSDEEYETDNENSEEYETDEDDCEEEDEEYETDKTGEEDEDEWETADEDEDEDEDEDGDGTYDSKDDTSDENWAETATVKKMKEFLTGISEEDKKNPIIKNILDEMKKSEKNE